MVNLKFNVTKYIAEQYGLPVDEKSIKKLVPQWWQNPRRKEKGGLKLTDEGFARLSAHITYHRVRFEEPQEIITNQLILQLDNLITCPWFLTKREVYVFDDKVAIQLVLFSGNIIRFTKAKAESIKNSLT